MNITKNIKKITMLLTVLMLVALATGCVSWSNTPLHVLRYDQPGQHEERRLIVFLRGMGGGNESFEEQGFVDEVLARGLAYDMAAPDVHIGYYMDRSMIQRLKEDVIDPAKAEGCRKIWLVGASMGGLGAILYLKEYPEDVAGVYLMAPFLGTQSILDEIDAAGGLSCWKPGALQDDDDWQRMLWTWLKTEVAGRPEKIVYLGYGTEDFYGEGALLLAPVLPPDRVYAIAGGHDYSTFKALWKMFLSGSAPLRVRDEP
jgi:pimeloyl-ACP methyl ester carboxylesterase